MNLTRPLQRVALVAERDPEQKKYRRRVVKVGADDPHTAYANMLCDVAWARAHRRPEILMPDARPVPASPLERLIDAHPDGARALPPDVLAALQRARYASPPPGLTCGDCRGYEAATRTCGPNRWGTTPTERACVLYAQRGG